MIVRDTPHSFKLFFILRGSVLPLIYGKILFITLLGVAVAVAQHFYPCTCGFVWCRAVVVSWFSQQCQLRPVVGGAQTVGEIGGGLAQFVAPVDVVH